MMKIYAHRGASKEAEENTLDAFQKALDIGVDGIELDCMITKDRVPIVTHYDNLKHLKEVECYVRKMTWKEIKELDIPTLTEVLELIRPTKTKVIFDIKQQPGFNFISPRIIAGLAQEMLPAEQILMSTFYWRHLYTLRKYFPLLPRALILMYRINCIVPMSLYDFCFDLRSIHPRLKWIRKKTVRRWQSKGLKIYAWIANTMEEMRYCEKMGIDGIFTDDPRFAKQVIGKEA